MSSIDTLQWRRHSAGAELVADSVNVRFLFPDLSYDMGERKAVARELTQHLKTLGAEARHRLGWVYWDGMPLATMRRALETMGLDWVEFKRRVRWQLLVDQAPPG